MLISIRVVVYHVVKFVGIHLVYFDIETKNVIGDVITIFVTNLIGNWIWQHRTSSVNKIFRLFEKWSLISLRCWIKYISTIF